MAGEVCSLVAQFLYESGYRNSLKAFEQESGHKHSLRDLEKQGNLLRILDEHHDLTRDKVTNHSWFHNFTEEDVSFANKLLMCLDNVSYGANVLTVRLTSDGVLGVGSARGFLSILDLGSPITKQTELDLPLEDPVHEAGLLTLDFNPQVSSLLLTGSMDRKVHLLEVSTEKVNVLQTFQDHRKYVVRVRWSPSGTYFATASYDYSVCVYRDDGSTEDKTSFKLCKRLEFKGQIESIAFRKRCDELIVAVRDDNVLHVVDMTEEEPRKAKKLNMNALGDDYVSFTAMDISCSPDDKLLLVSTDQSRLILYTIDDGKQVANFYGCTNDEFSQPRHCWHPTGRYIYSTSQDKSIKVWEVGTQRIVHNLVGHTDVVRDIFYCEELSVLVTCGFDGTVRLWHRPDQAAQQTSKADGSECEAGQDAL